MTSGWIEVFHGGLAEALIVQSKLEAFDIPTLLPGRSVREIDPFITGAGPLSQTVEVPPEAAERARELISERGTGDEVLPEPTAQEVELMRVTGLGRNLRWAAVFSLMIPILGSIGGVLVGLRYLSEARGLEVKPVMHTWSLISFGVCVVMGVVYVQALGVFS